MTHDNDDPPLPDDETAREAIDGATSAGSGDPALQGAAEDALAGGLEGAAGESGSQAAGEAGQAIQTGTQVAGGAAGAIGAATSGNVAGAVSGAAGAVGAVGGAAGGEAGQAVQTGAQVVGAAAGAIGAASSGNVAGTVSALTSGAGSVAGAVGGEAGQAVQAGAQVVGAAAQAIGGLTGGGSSQDSRIVPEGEAQEVLSGAAGALGHGRDTVQFVLEVKNATESWGVNRVSLAEQLNTVPSCFVEARYAGHLEVSELLHSEAVLFVERAEHRREFRGIVWHARVDEHAHEDGVVVQLEIVPRARLLATHKTRKLFQGRTAVEVVEEVYGNLLGSFQQTVNLDGLQRTYETREYCVQYDETDLAFISRLCEDEGIFWYFDHEQAQPVLMLADTVSGLTDACDGPVDFTEHQGQTPDFETVWDIHHVEEIGTTDVFLRGYDWTNPSLTVEKGEVGRSDAAPAREVYDPRTHAMIYDEYAGEQYGNNTAKVQAKLLAERLDLSRQQWSMSTSVVGARPGTVIELRGAPDSDFDQRYLIVAVHASGSATEDTGGHWDNTLDVVPVSMPYRPARKTPRPTTNGITTAIVVGPSNSEIHTDEHGRVRVRFHWDRDHERGDELSSCWMRVAHHWAGPGFGTFFLPRVGMEVIVSFLEGDPDRPLVTGCVYHGHNRAGVELDAKKTQSLIRTKSSPNSDGFNEMRFEDEAGNEFIYVHAQKDYNEVVEHCHSTHVKVDQSNTVDHDDTETVGNDQKLHVKNDRRKEVDNDERTKIGGNRTESVTGSEQIHIHESRKTKIEEDEKLVVHGNRKMMVHGRNDQEIVDGREVVVTTFDNLKVEAGANRNVVVSGQYNVTVDGAHYTLVQGDTEKFTQGSEKTYLESATEVHAKTGSSHLLMKSGGEIKLAGDTKIELEVGSCKIEMSTDTITLSAGSSSIELGPSGVATSGANVTSSAQTLCEITGLLVKIN